MMYGVINLLTETQEITARAYCFDISAYMHINDQHLISSTFISGD